MAGGRGVATSDPKQSWRDGSQRVLERTYLDPGLCVGCGTCGNRCPAFDQAGIRVSSAAETRSAKNRPVPPCSCSVPIERERPTSP